MVTEAKIQQPPILEKCRCFIEQKKERCTMKTVKQITLISLIALLLSVPAVSQAFWGSFGSGFGFSVHAHAHGSSLWHPGYWGGPGYWGNPWGYYPYYGYSRYPYYGHYGYPSWVNRDLQSSVPETSAR